MKHLIPYSSPLLTSCIILLLVSCEKSPSIIEINSQPQDGTVCYNGQFDLSINASCTEGLQFQWQQLNGATWINVGEDMPVYRTDSLKATAMYRVFVFSDDENCEPVYSDEVTVAVIDSLRITQQPIGRILISGGTTHLYAFANGPSDLHYQWESFDSTNWIAVGNDENKFLVENIQATTSFRVLVSSPAASCSSVYSDEAVVRVASIDKIIGHYIGVCYQEESHLDYMHQVVIDYDTFHMAEIDVTYVGIVQDTIFSVQVGPESPLDLTRKYITVTELIQDTISKQANYGNYSFLAEWILPSKQMNTEGRTSSITYYYNQTKCFYQKVE